MKNNQESFHLRGMESQQDPILSQGLLSLGVLASLSSLDLPDDLDQICGLASDLVEALKAVEGNMAHVDWTHHITPALREDLVCTLMNSTECQQIGLKPQEAYDILLLIKEATKYSILASRQKQQTYEKLRPVIDCVIPPGHPEMPQEWRVTGPIQ